MVSRKTPFQSFRLDLEGIANCVAYIREGKDTRQVLALELGMGEKKIEGYFEWAEFLGLLEDKPRTRPQVLKPLGQKLSMLPGFSRNVQALEILYATITSNHPLLEQIVNHFAYGVSRQTDPIFGIDTFKKELLAIGQDFNVNPDFLAKRASIYLDLLVNPISFGKLGIFVNKDDGSIRINSYRPDWRSFAYILFSSWPNNTSRVRISEIINGHNSPGRIFFMTESQVMLLLSKLEQERAIALEIIADLNQVGLNPAMKAEDFLEMLIHDQS